MRFMRKYSLRNTSIRLNKIHVWYICPTSTNKISTKSLGKYIPTLWIRNGSYMDKIHALQHYLLWSPTRWPVSWNAAFFSATKNYVVGGETSHMFFIFTPKSWGKMEFNLTCGIFFFRWVWDQKENNSTTQAKKRWPFDRGNIRPTIS